MIRGFRVMFHLARTFGGMYTPPPALSWREWRAVTHAAKHDLLQRCYLRRLDALLLAETDTAKRQLLQHVYVAVYTEYAIDRFGPLAEFFLGREDQIPLYGADGGNPTGEERRAPAPNVGDSRLDTPRM